MNLFKTAVSQALNETFDYVVKPFTKKDGTKSKVILLTASGEDNTFKYKDKLKNSFGCYWMEKYRAWGWYTSQDKAKNDNIIKRFVRPAIEYLTTVEHNDEKRDIEEIINKLVKLLDSDNLEVADEPEDGNYATIDEIRRKINDYKERLVSAMNSTDFEALMMPIINAKRARGWSYSLTNTILIMLQDSKATNVRSAYRWEQAGRKIKPNAKAIGLYRIVGDNIFKTKEEKEAATAKFLKREGVSSEKELTPGKRDILRTYLNRSAPNGRKRFIVTYSNYDIRFTEPIEGKDEIGDTDTSKIKWFDNEGDETENSKEKIEALLEVIKDSSVTVSKAESLGGALGVSKSGHIEILSSAIMNRGMFSTLTHEFSHELLHQTYLKDRRNEFSRFFVGKAEGRGMVEQQAEISAWIVLKFYGMDSNTSINYATVWGLDKTCAVKVFDSVASVAVFIIDKINEKIKEKRGEPMTEAVDLNTNVKLSGLDVAEMLGCGDIYREGEKELAQKGENAPSTDPTMNDTPESEDDNQIKDEIKESFFKFYNRIIKN